MGLKLGFGTGWGPKDMNEIQKGDGSGARLAVLNPVGYPPKISKRAPAPRLDSLDGKTVYLVDCRFDDSIELLKEVKDWFAEFMPGVQSRIISLTNVYQKDDPETWKEIKANGHAAIVGVGH